MLEFRSIQKVGPPYIVAADDLTGAGDVASVYHEAGFRTLVIPSPFFHEESGVFSSGFDVIVLNLASRYLGGKRLRERMKVLIRFLERIERPLSFFKIDSTLRGSIGESLEILLDAGVMVRTTFVPAFPEMGRITVDGIHFVGGLPVADTPYGKDDKWPLRSSRIEEIIGKRNKITRVRGTPVSGGGKVSSKEIPEQDARIILFDISNQYELNEAAQTAAAFSSTSHSGSSAWAGALIRAGLFGKNGDDVSVIPFDSQIIHSGGTLVIAGTRQPSFYELVRLLEKRRIVSVIKDTGFTARKMEVCSGELELGRNVLIFADPVPRNARYVEKKLSRAASLLYEKAASLVLIGGETAYSCVSGLGFDEMVVAGRLGTGIPVFMTGRKPVVTCPGGFANMDFFEKIFTG